MMQQSLKERNYVSIVMVLSKASKDAISFIDALKTFCATRFNSYEFVLVDNNADKTLIKTTEDYFHDKQLSGHLVSLPFEVDKEQAVFAGVDAAIGDCVFEITDTVLDYSIQDLWKMYEAYLSGSDIVLLKPSGKTGFVTNCFYKILKKYAHKRSIMYPSRVRLISRRAINRIGDINKIVCYRKYAYCNSGLNYVFIEYQPIVGKIKKQLTLETFSHATDLLLMFTNLGKHISIIFSLVFAIASAIAFSYTVFAYLMENVISGWTTTMLLLSVSFTGIFSCFAIVIKYLNILLLSRQQENVFIGDKRRLGL